MGHGMLRSGLGWGLAVAGAAAAVALARRWARRGEADARRTIGGLFAAAADQEPGLDAAALASLTALDFAGASRGGAVLGAELELVKRSAGEVEAAARLLLAGAGADAPRLRTARRLLPWHALPARYREEFIRTAAPSLLMRLYPVIPAPAHEKEG